MRLRHEQKWDVCEGGQGERPPNSSFPLLFTVTMLVASSYSGTTSSSSSGPTRLRMQGEDHCLLGW